MRSYVSVQNEGWFVSTARNSENEPSAHVMVPPDPVLDLSKRVCGRRYANARLTR